jgi:predicted GIY-YIG superfamily endonuclease
MLYSEENTPCVYLIYSTSGHFKIGYSKNPEARLKQLQQTQGVYEYSLIQTMPFVSSEEARKAEVDFHQQYEEKRIRGEWFLLEPRDLIELGMIGELTFQLFLAQVSEIGKRYIGSSYYSDVSNRSIWGGI